MKILRELGIAAGAGDSLRQRLSTVCFMCHKQGKTIENPDTTVLSEKTSMPVTCVDPENEYYECETADCEVSIYAIPYFLLRHDCLRCPGCGRFGEFKNASRGDFWLDVCNNGGCRVREFEVPQTLENGEPPHHERRYTR